MKERNSDRERMSKRQQTGCLSEEPPRNYAFSKQLLTNFSELGSELQNRILEVVENSIENDKSLHQLCLKHQVRMHVHSARLLFEQRRLGHLEELLSRLAPAAAIMMNYEISLVNANYSEESATLARTLLPFIDRVSDFGFLGPDTSFISGRFLASLALHIKDVQCSVSPGFISFALHVNPSALKSIISKGENVIALREALL